MTRQKTLSEQNGPTVNGRPLLTSQEVRAWFKQHKGDVKESSANKIIALLTEYEFIKFFWNKTPKQQKQERNSPYWLRNRQIADALVTLQAELPSIIADNLKIFPDGKSERVIPFLDLSDIVGLRSKRGA
jgi:hypothetical protein